MTTALVTGATSGIGLEFARQLAMRGHDLVLVARDRARLREVATQLGPQCGVDIEVLPADLSVRSQLELVSDRVADPSRPIDILVNNAGFGLARDFLDGDIADEERLLDVLCRAVLVLSHAGARGMRDRGHGQIINVASVAAFAAMGTYSAAKSWVVVFTEGLSYELTGTGVTATALCPGFTHTEFHQRAQMNMTKLPEAMWLGVEELVAACLDDVGKGRVVSVPGPIYKVMTGALGIIPRPLVRRATGLVSSRRRPRSE